MTRPNLFRLPLACLMAMLLLSACPGAAPVTPPANTTDAAPSATPPPDDPQAAQCGPSTCTYGCCYQGECVTGNSDVACGQGGYQCQQCSGDTICQAGACAAKEKVETCGPNNCNGCCDGNTCRPGLSNAQCGKSGQTCNDCSQSNGICNAATQQCATDCKPNCAGKCAGIDDGCGGTCQLNDCKGCCNAAGQCAPGNANDACGTPGAKCADCNQFSAQCQSGICQGCTPNCAGKCKGAADGCGGTCGQSQCNGCCNKGQCLAGNTEKACGTTGGACSDCSTKQMNCSAGKCETKGGTNPGGGNFPPADGPGCTPDCDERCLGEADGCGGICWDNTCSGCCSSYGECLSGLSDVACGSYGSSCEVCPLDYLGYDWTCSLYTQSCVQDNATSTTPPPSDPPPSNPPPSNPPPSNTNVCSGQADQTTCYSNNKVGACYSGSCCTGCYDSVYGTCESGQSDDYDCGWGGDECKACANNETCQSGFCNATSSQPPPSGGTPNECSGQPNETVCTSKGGNAGGCWYGTCCDGCYDTVAGTCRSGDSHASCGIGGEKCAVCNSSQICSGSTCITDSGGYDWTSGTDDKFTLRLERLTVDGMTNWDLLGNAAPDIVFAIKLGQTNCSAGAPYSACTGQIADVTANAIFMNDLVTATAADLKKTHCIYIFDADDDYTSPCKDGSYDLVGSCNITITQQHLNDGKLLLSSCTQGSTNYVNQVDFSLIAE